MITTLKEKYPLGIPIQGEEAQKDFIRLFGAILRVRNILGAFDEFEGNEILTERDYQDYQSVYIDLYQEYRPRIDADKEDINDDIEFEIELIKQIEVNIDYILMLVAKYHESNCTDKSILTAIDKAVGSSLELRSKRELIERFIEQINVSSHVEEDWRTFCRTKGEGFIRNN